ncbi:MAG: ABC transporter substrate-binding protein [Spirochaetia bacterium]|jgi:raffinose/stachyose/melibiose transport system substrate-binding protein
MKKLGLLFLVAMCMLVVGIPSFAQAKVTITYQTPFAKETDQVGVAIDAYVKAHPNIEFDYQVIDHADMPVKMPILVQSNSLPDLFWDNGAHFVDYLMNSQSLLDLTPYYDAAFKATFVKGALTEITTPDGRIAAYPSESQVQGWVWNKALFDKYGLKIPTTYEELKADVPVFKRNGVVTLAYGSKEGWAVWGFEHWLVLWGIWDQADQVFKTHTLRAQDADFKQAYYSEAELYALGAFPQNNSTMSFDQACSLFNSGKAAAITLPSDQLGKIIGQPLEKNYVFNWGVTFPKSPYKQNVKVRAVPNGFGVGANVASDPDKLKAIVDFNKFRYSAQGFPLALSLGSILPVNVKFDASKLGAIMKQQIALIQDNSIIASYNSDYASYRIWDTNADLWTEGWGTIRGNLENSLMNGSMTAKDIPGELAKIDAAIDVVNGKLADLRKSK